MPGIFDHRRALSYDDDELNEVEDYGAVPLVLAAPVAVPVGGLVLVGAGLLAIGAAATAVATMNTDEWAGQNDTFSNDSAMWKGTIASLAALAGKPGRGQDPNKPDPCLWVQSPQTIIMRYVQILYRNTVTNVGHMASIGETKAGVFAQMSKKLSEALKLTGEIPPTKIMGGFGFSLGMMQYVMLVIAQVMLSVSKLGLVTAEMAMDAFYDLGREMQACGVNGAWVSVATNTVGKVMGSKDLRRAIGASSGLISWRSVAVAALSAAVTYMTDEVADERERLESQGVDPAEIEDAFRPVPMPLHVQDKPLITVECKPSSARWRAEGVDAALMSATGRLCSTGCVNPGVFTVLVRERGLWAMLTDALGDPQGVVLEPGSTYRMWKDERGVLRFSEG